MYGFLIGDIIGNSYTHENESFNLKTKDFSLFTNRSKKLYRRAIGYPLSYELNKFREEYNYTSAAVGTVIASLLCVFKSNSFEDALRNAVSLGGDTDTITSITCAVAESIYDSPNKLIEQCLKFLPTEFIKLLKDFNLYLLENK